MFIIFGVQDVYKLKRLTYSEVETFRILMPHSNMVEYQHFRGPCCLWNEDGGAMVLQNCGMLPHYCTVSKARRSQLEPSSPWKSQRV